jgi:hypothetical protein
MRSFFTYYEMQDYPSIYTRFTLNSKSQVDALKDYLDYIVSLQLQMQEK